MLTSPEVILWGASIFMYIYIMYTYIIYVYNYTYKLYLYIAVLQNADLTHRYPACDIHDLLPVSRHDAGPRWDVLEKRNLG